MSIIVDCEMPDVCFNCPMYNEDYDECRVYGRRLNMHMVKSTRAEWCPIQPGKHQSKIVASFFIKGRLPGLNDYIRADRADKHQGSKLKREVEDMIIWQLARMPKITDPARYHFTWYEPDERRDKDNVAFAKKFIFDALQKSGRLINDNNKYVVGFSDEFVYHVKEGVGVRIERAD